MDPVAVAHRGDPYVARENTLPSLRSALAAGADAVEFDVRTTADGVPVLLHDATLKRLWGHDVPLAELPHADVVRLTRGGVPTLRAALRVMAERPGARSFVDLPHPAAAEATVAEVHQVGAAEQTFYCGDVAAMMRVRAAEPTAEIALTCKSLAPYADALLTRLRPRWLNYRFGLLEEWMVRRDHDAGYLVSAWTVDWRRNMRRLLDMGVDSVTTNRVSCLRRLLDDRALARRGVVPGDPAAQPPSRMPQGEP